MPIWAAQRSSALPNWFGLYNMALVVAGTGTDVGKTLASALIMARYAGQGVSYIKPVQTGESSDRLGVIELAELDASDTLPEIYSFAMPASPHYAAELESARIEPELLLKRLQGIGKPLVIELAGGLMVPLTRGYTNLDLVRDLGATVLLVASTGLGTINHSLLSFTALRAAGVRQCGFLFVGKSDRLREDNIRTVLQLTGADLVGEMILPDDVRLSPVKMRELAAAFDRQEKLRQFLT